MQQISKLQKAAVDLVSKYFGQSTAEMYNGFFAGESDSNIVASVNEIMVEYLGENKAKEEIKKFMENLAV
jgi:2',3'-cyclic-nucleotide 2'-phosphodiesterase (5'-nucleotidase family)